MHTVGTQSAHTHQDTSQTIAWAGTLSANCPNQLGCPVTGPVLAAGTNWARPGITHVRARPSPAASFGRRTTICSTHRPRQPGARIACDAVSCCQFYWLCCAHAPWAWTSRSRLTKRLPRQQLRHTTSPPPEHQGPRLQHQVCHRLHQVCRRALPLCARLAVCCVLCAVCSVKGPQLSGQATSIAPSIDARALCALARSALATGLPGSAPSPFPLCSACAWP